MYDASDKLLRFYDRHVKLETSSEKRLVEVRNLNIKRIEGGLKDLDKPRYRFWRNQGGYAMKTVINDPAGESDHDIDVAMIFDKNDLPSGPLQARQQVRDALRRRGTNFLQEPEARTNAVTVWYADGYHLDFAVYRRSTNMFGHIIYEHASTDWTERDPSEVTNWFLRVVEEKSPATDAGGNKPKVRSKQVRRIVRLAKWFCRSRPSWSLPGGMIMSTLVVECYRSDAARDDLALYNTLSAIRDRLKINCRVYHPLGNGRELTGKSQYLRQVTLLKEKLEANLPKLDVLFKLDCSPSQAQSAWDWIFNHAFWSGTGKLEESTMAKADTSVGNYFVQMACQVAKRERGRTIGDYRGHPLPKRLSLRFYVTATNVPAPYTLRFKATNSGDEARLEQCLGWSGETDHTRPEWWTSTLYKGTHRMTCCVEKYGTEVASTTMVIKIAGR